MPKYHFDTWDDGVLSKDDTGVELASLEQVRSEATTSLAELALETLRGSVFRTLIVEARDDTGPILRAALRFEIETVGQDRGGHSCVGPLTRIKTR